jgi:hypothetical protein
LLRNKQERRSGADWTDLGMAAEICSGQEGSGAVIQTITLAFGKVIVQEFGESIDFAKLHAPGDTGVDCGGRRLR